MIVKVLQINIRPLSDEINRLGSWSKAADAYPEVKAYHQLSISGSPNYEPWMLEHFTLTHVLEVGSLEECFAVCNGQPVDGAWFIHRGQGPSLSVGDLVVACTQEGEVAHMVDPVGFAEIDVAR